MEEEHTTHPALLKLARQVARELDNLVETWKARPNYEQSGHLVRKNDSLILRFSCDNLYGDKQDLTDKRIEIAGVYPRDFRGYHYSAALRMNEHLPTIGISANRAPAQIASDIRRRLLPDVELHTERARAWVQQELDAHKSKVATQKRLAKAGDGELLRPLSNDVYAVSNRYRAGAISWRADVGYRGSVSLKFNDLPPELAEKILRAVARFEKERDRKE